MEFAPRPDHGRRFSHTRRVRLSDAGPDAVLRPDGVARYLQDVATDDWASTGLDPNETWVVRRTTMRVAAAGRWPALGEEVAVITWCGGTGPAWAERRSDLEVDGRLVVETVALWVPLDPTGKPTRIGQNFQAVYGGTTGGRRVSGRLEAPTIAPGALGRPWPTRRADLDVVGHVNNAALWAAVTESIDGALTEATVSHHGPLTGKDDITLVTAPGHLWLVAGGEIRTSATFDEEKRRQRSIPAPLFT